jgi:hypothetical protein
LKRVAQEVSLVFKRRKFNLHISRLIFSLARHQLPALSRLLAIAMGKKSLADCGRRISRVHK